MRTRRSTKFNGYGVKAIVGKKVVGTKKFYFIQWEDKKEENLFVDFNYLQYDPLLGMTKKYDALEESGEKNITVNAETVRSNDTSSELEVILIDGDKVEVLKENRKRKQESPSISGVNILLVDEENVKEVKKNKKKVLNFTSDNINNNVNVLKFTPVNENKQHVLHGRTVFEPIKLDGKEITMADILKFSKLYNRFNDYTGVKINKIFGRSHEICYNDIIDYKFYGLIEGKKVIVFTKEQVEFKEFFFPMYEFMKKYPFTETDPPF